jgi:hypothetical protein
LTNVLGSSLFFGAPDLVVFGICFLLLERPDRLRTDPRDYPGEDRPNSMFHPVGRG